MLEDIQRYVYDNATHAKALKELRHQSRVSNYLEILHSRDIVGDCLKTSTASEQTRENLHSIQLANFKRAQESARVLEELFKLDSPEDSERFKTIRYQLYDLEKQALLNAG